MIFLKHTDANAHPSARSTHAAPRGGLWQCVLQNFGGLRVLGGKLMISPNLPQA